MTRKELAAIRKRCEATTQGLWKISCDSGLVFTEITTMDEDRRIALVWTKREKNTKDGKLFYETVPELAANAEFIANAKRDILRLLDYIEGKND